MVLQRRSVATIAICSLLLVVTVVLSGIGACLYWLNSEAQWTQLQHRSEIYADEITTSLVSPVWNIDRDQVDKVVRSWMQEQRIYGIQVDFAGSTQGLY